MANNIAAITNNLNRLSIIQRPNYYPPPGGGVLGVLVGVLGGADVRVGVGVFVRTTRVGVLVGVRVTDGTTTSVGVRVGVRVTVGVRV
jgi:hypothetical protein